MMPALAIWRWRRIQIFAAKSALEAKYISFLIEATKFVQTRWLNKVFAAVLELNFATNPVFHCHCEIELTKHWLSQPWYILTSRLRLL